MWVEESQSMWMRIEIERSSPWSNRCFNGY
jgi:hypothetical protein